MKMHIYTILLLFVTSVNMDLLTHSHSAVLDAQGKYKISWTHKDGIITFLLQVETLGYVGFGFSPNGAMASSDIVIGGVYRGKSYFQVCIKLAHFILDLSFVLLKSLFN